MDGESAAGLETSDGSGMRRVRLAEWARSQGISRMTAYRMLQRGIMPVPTERSPTGRWYVLLPMPRHSRLALYTRASNSPDQAEFINDQIATLSEWSTHRGQQPYIVVKEFATPLVHTMPKLANLLADRRIAEIAVADPTVVGEALFELLVAVLAPQGRRIVAVHNSPRNRSRRVNDLSAGILSLCKELHGPELGTALARQVIARRR